MKTWKWKKSHQNQERALALCRDGFSCAEIAVMMGLCTITVRNYLRDAGVIIPDQRCRRQKVLNTADADRVVRLYQTPLPAVMVARMLGLSVDLVVAVLRSAGVLRPQGRWARSTRIDVARAIKLYKVTGSVHRVGKQMGCAGSAVWRVLKDAGVVRNHRQSVVFCQEPRRRKIVEAWQQGHDPGEIARLLGYSKESVLKQLRTAGITPAYRWSVQGAGPLVRAARTEAGFTQTELARRLNFESSRISDYERGRVGLRLGRIRQIAAAIGCPFGRLLPEWHRLTLLPPVLDDTTPEPRPEHTAIPENEGASAPSAAMIPIGLGFFHAEFVE
jgi:transcriptional regulator with XRE-family HTH domain/DNA-binding CsgD family transcriptional regulator